MYKPPAKIKHTNGSEPCDSCEEKLALVHPDLAAWFRDEVRSLWNNAHVSWGFRNKADQDWAKSTGESNDSWPNSKHNHMENGKPCSLAVDLFQQNDAGMGVWSVEWYGQVYKLIQAKASPIKWGAFIKLPKGGSDFNHFELID